MLDSLIDYSLKGISCTSYVVLQGGTNATKAFHFTAD